MYEYTELVNIQSMTHRLAVKNLMKAMNVRFSVTSPTFSSVKEQSSYIRDSAVLHVKTDVVIQEESQQGKIRFY